MSEEAAKFIVRAAAPGQSDAVAESVRALSASSDWIADVQKEVKDFQCIDIHANDLDQHPFAKPLHEKIEQYQKDNFLSKPGVSARLAMTKGDGDLLLVHTYAEKFDAPNQYSAHWKATWTIGNVQSDTGEISGQVAVHSSAYEDGNVQLKIDKVFPAVLVGKTALKEAEEPSLVTGMVKQIMKWETIILGILESMNDSISSDHMKSIRRVLPVTKTKMNWDVVAHRSVRTLKQAAPDARNKVT